MEQGWLKMYASRMSSEGCAWLWVRLDLNTLETYHIDSRNDNVLQLHFGKISRGEDREIHPGGVQYEVEIQPDFHHDGASAVDISLRFDDHAQAQCWLRAVQRVCDSRTADICDLAKDGTRVRWFDRPMVSNVWLRRRKRYGYYCRNGAVILCVLSVPAVMAMAVGGLFGDSWSLGIMIALFGSFACGILCK